MFERVSPLLLVAVHVLLAASCTGSATMSTRMTRAPMLLGPVACIGCPPSPRPQWDGPPPIVVPATANLMASGGLGVTATSANSVRPAIGRGIERYVPNPCRADVRVSRLSAKAYGLFALLFAMSTVDIVLEGYPTEVPSGTCTAAAPSGPTLPERRPGPPSAVSNRPEGGQ